MLPVEPWREEINIVYLTETTLTKESHLLRWLLQARTSLNLFLANLFTFTQYGN